MPLPRSVCAATVAVSAALTASCRSALKTGEWAASPVLQMTALDASEDCRSHSYRVPALASSKKLRIGSWNMHYLGPSEKTPDERRDPRELAEYVRLSGASVLALQEIGIEAGAREPRSATLDAMFGHLRAAGGGDWTYLLYGDPDKDTNQFVGLAWDRRVVTQVGEPMKLELNESAPGPIPLLPFVPMPFSTDLWMRKPFAVELSTGPGSTDLVFIPIHLTSRVETFFYEDATAHREAEAEGLSEALGTVITQFHDRDVVVLGDFNVEVATEDVAEALVERGWRDLNCANLGTDRVGMALDRFFVPNDQPEFGIQPNFARVVPPGFTSWGDFVDRYSDHLLVVADVLVGPDDD